jgi:hypothetical protein
MSALPFYGADHPFRNSPGWGGPVAPTFPSMSQSSPMTNFNPIAFILQSMFSQQPQAPSWNAGGYGGIGTGGMGGWQNMNMGEIRQPGGGYGNWGGSYGGGFGGSYGNNSALSPLMSLLSLLQSFRAPTAPSGIPTPQGNPAANTVPAGQGQFGNRNTPLTRPINSSVFNPAPSGPPQDRSRAYTRGSSAY